MKKISIFIYGIAAYLMFLTVFLYAIGFIGNIKVNNSLDALSSIPTLQAISVNLCLLTFFGIQFFGMARKGFRNWIIKYIPKSAERSTYVLISNCIMVAIFYFWEPIGGVIWNTDNEYIKTLFLTIYMFGWSLTLVSTCLINHFQIFGIQQVWHQLIGKKEVTSLFVKPSLYNHVRHPLYLGTTIVLWATPVMTISHFIFALTFTAYIFFAIKIEEKNLLREFGDEYKAYSKQVPMLVPVIKRSSKQNTIETT